MKKLMAGLLLSLSLLVDAADLRAVGGRIYCNAEIVKVAAGHVQIVYDDGNATLSLNDLPENFIAAMSSSQRIALQNMVDLKLPSGKCYYKTSISSLENNVVKLTHLKGTVNIPFDKLPAIYRATFTRKQLASLKKVPEKARKIKREAVVTGERTPDNDVIYRGPRGGKYFINDLGKKVYIPADQ